MTTTDPETMPDLTDGCDGEHSPGSNPDCEMRPVNEAAAADLAESMEEPDVEVLPDMHDKMIGEMREGVLRYRELAVVEDHEADKHLAQVGQCRDTAREYRAKAVSLGDIVKALGYDVDDRTVSPADPDGVHP